jgi:membrane protease YdiL (CAAX protease family)
LNRGGDEDHPPRRPFSLSLGSAALLVLAALLFEMVADAALGDLSGALGLSPGAVGALARWLSHGLLLIIVIHSAGWRLRDVLHHSPVPAPATIAALLPPLLLLTPALLAADTLAGSLIEQWLPLSQWERDAFDEMASPSIANVVMVCMMAPLLEELLFRGVILRGFLRRYDPVTAVVHSAAVFGLAHLNVHQFFVAFPLGLIAGWLLLRTGSLWPGILLHGLLNTGVTLLSQQAAGTDPSLGEWAGLLVLCGVPGLWWLRRAVAHWGERP